MNAAELQQFVKSLIQPLRTSGASKVASELERVCAGFEPFKEMTIAQFADFLVQAEEYKRTGVLVPKGGKSSKAKATPVIDRNSAAQLVMQLYERAADPELQYTAIDAEIKKLEKLKVGDVVAVAGDVGISIPKKTKKTAALAEIKRMITERKRTCEYNSPKSPDKQEDADFRQPISLGSDELR